jgi:hypothetical protein
MEGGVQELFSLLCGVSCKGRWGRVFIGVILVSLRGREEFTQKLEVKMKAWPMMAARMLRAIAVSNG